MFPAARHAACVEIVQALLVVEQHAPVGWAQGFGVQTALLPWYDPVCVAQLAEVSTVQVPVAPLGPQQAPVAGGGGV